MTIIDRYVIRQVVAPLLLGLLVFTFIFIIPLLIEYAEVFIAKGVPAPVVAQIILTLVPQALGVSIPMSLLLGLLVGFGRLSADREFVAMQACGISLWRLLRPVGLVSVACWAATSYVLLVALPSSNQRFREITFDIVAQRAEGEVRPRVFFEDFPNLVLYVRDIPPSGAGWQGVFMVDMRRDPPSTYVARRGRVLIDRQKQTVEMVLDEVFRHTADQSGKYDVSRSERVVLGVDPSTIFPREGPMKGENEMTVAELQARAAEVAALGRSPHNYLMAIHRKFSIPVACLVFGLIGLALGASKRRDGALGSFVLGLIVIFAYYVPLYLGPNLARGGLVPAWLAVWLPNLILGALGVALFVWRDRVADQPIRLPLPRALERRLSGGTRPAVVPRLPMLTLLDRYVALKYGRVLALSAAGLAGVFYISTFIDLSDEVLKGQATWRMLAEYFWFATPQYVYYVLPLSVLMATLATVAILTKNSELVVMKACGISLYRIAVPMVFAAALAGGVLF
ncbi:MAG TPA: LptF/LptG family permease, partial [Vicinamibacterales bacterium]|nr:LptF/LptG family permease [Vicinamibacterales bacterium]